MVTAILTVAGLGASACGGSSSGAGVRDDAPAASVTEPTTITTPPSSTTMPAPTATLGPSGPQVVELEDRSRPVVVKGHVVAATRRLPTFVWLPPGTGPHPLVVFAHGYDVGPLTYVRFCAAIAAAGYVVAAPSFPAADPGRGLGLDRVELPAEARDVAFVASSLRSESFAGAIAPGSFGVVGHSDGADVALDAGFAAGLSDPSVGAVVAIAPDAFSFDLAPAPRPPLLLVHSDADPVVPWSESVQVFGRVATQRQFVTLQGADHLPPVATSTRWTPIVDAATVGFLDAVLRGTTTLDAARRAMVVPGLSTLRIAD